MRIRLRVTSANLAILLALAMVVGGFAACRKAAAPTAAPSTPPSSQTTAPPPPAATASGPVREVMTGSALGANNRVAAPQTRFQPQDTVYVSVVTSGLAPGTQLRARWLYEGDQLVTESTQTVASADATSEFHAANPGGWPEGAYRVDLIVGTETVGSATFKVAGPA